MCLVSVLPVVEVVRACIALAAAAAAAVVAVHGPHDAVGPRADAHTCRCDPLLPSDHPMRCVLECRQGEALNSNGANFGGRTAESTISPLNG